MADYSQGGGPPPPPMTGLHSGRIPSFKNSHGDNFQSCGPEPPACVQNAMMTKDKKPFTYTPGGLDLSQIKTPSMARRLNKQQQQQEDYDTPAYYRQPTVNGGPAPPPPPPPGPPPPPPLVINVVKPVNQHNEGERPEIVIPENPIGMLRKTNSPYHWESEEAGKLQQGPIPKFVEKSATPSPVAPQMRKAPPQQFSQQPPQQSQFSPTTQQHQNQNPQNTPQNLQQNYSQPSPQISNRYENNLPQQNKSDSPVWKPEPKYPSPALPQNNNFSPVPNMQQNQSPRYPSPAPAQKNNFSPVPNMQQNQSPTKIALQRQDSQFNLSPSPWGKESPYSNGTSTTSSSSNQTISPSCESNSSLKSVTPISSPASPWKQEPRNSPMQNSVRSPPAQSPYNDGFRVTPIHIEARETIVHPAQSMRSPNQSPYVETQTNSQNNPRWGQQQSMSPNAHPMSPTGNNIQVNMNNQSKSPSYAQAPSPANVKSPSPPRQNNKFPNNNMVPESDEVRYQSHMTIPVKPRIARNQNDQQTEGGDPLSPKLIESPKENLPWVRGQNTINKSIPPPPWCQRSESRKSVPRDSFEQTESPQSPWGSRPSDNRKSLPRETFQHTPQSSEPQPPWVTENRRFETLPRAQPGKVSSMPSSADQIFQNVRKCDSPGRVIPVQMEMSNKDMTGSNIKFVNAPGKQGMQGRNQQQPQLRIIIDMNQQGQPGQPQVIQQGQPQILIQPQPNISIQQAKPQMQHQQQHISRVLTPQMMRMDGATPGSPLRQEPPSGTQAKTRIIPIQMEPSSPVVTTPSRRN